MFIIIRRRELSEEEKDALGDMIESYAKMKFYKFALIVLGWVLLSPILFYVIFKAIMFMQKYLSIYLKFIFNLF